MQELEQQVKDLKKKLEEAASAATNPPEAAAPVTQAPAAPVAVPAVAGKLPRCIRPPALGIFCVGLLCRFSLR